MELLSPAWWSALATIVLIDLLLAGDNAIVIALAARSLPRALQRRAIWWGTVGAIAVRAAMTAGVVWLLHVPGLMFAGGAALLWIAWKLVVSGDEGEPAHAAATTLAGALRTIIVADALMGIDNVLGVAGVAHGSFVLVAFGLALSVPVVVFGSSFVLKLVQRFPVITYAGAAMLVFTAIKMMVADPLLATLT